MKNFARIFALLATATLCAASDDLMKRRTPEYDYDVPAAGEYQLPILQQATDGLVLGEGLAERRIRDLDGREVAARREGDVLPGW